MSIDTRKVVPAANLLVFAVLVLNAALTYTNLQTVADSGRWVGHTRQVVAELRHTLVLLTDAETGQRGYLLTGRDAYLEPYRAAVAGLGGPLGRLADLTADNPQQQGRIAELRRLADAKMAELARTVTLRRERGLDDALEVVLTDEGRRAMDQARRVVAAMEADEDHLLDRREAASRLATRRTVVTFSVATAAALLLLMLASYLKRRQDAERGRAAEAIRRSESWLSTTLTSIGDAVIATDGTGHVRFLNPIAESLTGWTQAEAAGRPLEEVFVIASEESRRPVESPVDRVIREGVIVGLANHTIVISRDGGETAIEDSAAPIKDASGRVVGVVLVFQDATERRRHERQLREGEERSRLAEERLRLMVESVTDYAIFSTDPQGVVTTWNAGAERVFGYREAEIIGRDAAVLYTPEDRASGVPVLELSGADEAGRAEDERWHVRKDGIRFFASGVVTPVRDEAGTLLGFTKVARDITQRMQFEEALRAAKEEAENANKAKDHFLAVLSHELRTPLNPILLAASSMLERTPEPDELRPTLEMIRQNVKLQARLIDDLLDVMRIVRGKMPLHWGVSDCHALIGQSIQICRSEFLGKAQGLVLDLSAEHHHVNADSARLHQVLWNLVRNAVKFTPEGGTINVRTRNDGSDERYIVIEVSDTGIGIEPDVLPHIFDPFQQGETTITRRFGGLGLGLAICKGVVDAHGGTLDVESEGTGRGTTFRVVLKAMTEPVFQAIGPENGEGHSPLPPLNRLNILLVEDEAATLRLMDRLLTGLGHRVTAAGTVADAWGAFQAGDFDMIVSDIGLPDGTGLDLMRRVKGVRRVPAIALTGYGMDEDVRRSRDAGFTTHMTKPIDFTKLEAMIRQVAN